MWPFFEKAELIVTYNGKYFDVPLIQKYTDKIDFLKIPHLDMFEKIREATGKKLGLDGVAGTTLGINKSANGLQAVAWWNSGEVEKIIKYCEQDVKVTKDLYEYILNNKKFAYIDRNSGKKIEAKIDVLDWEGEKENDLFSQNDSGEPQQMGLF